MNRLQPPSTVKVLCLVAVRTLAAARRQPSCLVVGILAVGLLGGARFFASFDFGENSAGFLIDFGLAVVFLSGSLVAVVLPAQLWIDEMNQRCAVPVLSSPVRRETFFFGVFFGASAAVGLFLILMFLALGILLSAWADGFGSAAWERLMGACWLTLVRGFLIGALMALLGSFSRSFLFVVCVGAGFVFAGELYPVAWALADDTAYGATLLNPLLFMMPNLGLFGSGSGHILGGAAPPVAALELSLYGAAYAALYLCLGAWIFRSQAW